jgi:putative heme-binding domain-containing protein
MQGAYLRKGFEKHGQLSNPHAFGYFPHMPNNKAERFTHTFVIYEGDALPESYRGKLFGLEPLQGRVVLSAIEPEGSTFRTRDLGYVVETSDRWFKPVDIKTGPDGALYIADWYDAQVNHWRNYQGNMDASNGRVYRLKARGAKPAAPIDLAAESSEALIARLKGANPWQRQTALRLLGDRRESAAPVLKRLATSDPGQWTLDEVWALAQGGQLTDQRSRRLLHHRDPSVRVWAVRLLGDDSGRLSPVTAQELQSLAQVDKNLEVRAQLACTAKRLPAAQGLPLVKTLLARDEDAADARQPLLLWWALESKSDSDGEAVLDLFEDSSIWDWPIVKDHILARLMRRYAAPGTRKELKACARLLNQAPSPARRLDLMRGFEEAFEGRSLAGLPEELVEALASGDLGSPAFKLRQDRPGALAAALRVIADPGADAKQRRRFIEVLGEVRKPEAIGVLLGVVEQDRSPELRKAALNSLLAYDDPDIGVRDVAIYAGLDAPLRPAAQTLLSSRSPWSVEWIRAVEAGRVEAAAIPADTVRRMRLHEDEALRASLGRVWPDARRPTTAEMERGIRRLAGVVSRGTGNPYQGKELYTIACGACHRLFNQGGDIGPDLTTFQRTDLDNFLLSIVNPSAEIREGYENVHVTTRDGRSLTGFVEESDAFVVVLRGLDGQRITLKRGEVDSMKSAGMSLMPEGLLDGFEDQQVRDLFAYLRSTQPLP